MARIDLLPIEATQDRVVQAILQTAKARPMDTIFLHDPLNRRGGVTVSAEAILKAPVPEKFIRGVLDKFGCNYPYWQSVSFS